MSQPQQPAESTPAVDSSAPQQRSDLDQLVDHDAYVAEFGCEPRNDGLKLPIVAAAFSGCHLEFVEKRAYDLNLNYFHKDGKLYVDCRRTLGLFLVFMP